MRGLLVIKKIVFWLYTAVFPSVGAPQRQVLIDKSNQHPLRQQCLANVRGQIGLSHRLASPKCRFLESRAVQNCIRRIWLFVFFFVFLHLCPDAGGGQAIHQCASAT